MTASGLTDVGNTVNPLKWGVKGGDAEINT
jgi:hypothetical protein